MIPLILKPLLVLTGEADSQQRDFYDIVPVGEKLLAFGAIHVQAKNVQAKNPMASAEILVPQPANNYRRWWNNPWGVVEKGGQRKAGVWTSQDEERLNVLVNHAHKMNLWIRFYTLNGHTEQDRKKNGWDKNYNFGSKEKVLLRWKAAVAGRVDFLATDQYEDVAKLLHDFPTIDSMTMSAPWTRVNFGGANQPIKAREKGAEHDHYRSRLPPELPTDCFCG